MKKLLTLLFVLAMVGMAFADVITIGTGTSNTYEPIASYYGYHRSATIYTSGEVGGSGTINTISFKAYNTTTTSIPVKVYMKMTTATTLAPAQSWPTLITGLTPLYEGTFSGTTAGAWKTITLTTPFAYTGTNLEISIESSYGGGGTTGPKWYYTTASNLNQYIRTDDVAPTTEVGYVNGNRPNIQLDMSSYSVFAPSFAVNVPSVSFGNVVMNTTSAYTDITVSNGGAGTLNITSAVLGGTDSGRFILDMNSNPTPWALGAGQSKTVKVAFNPTAAASYSAYLQFAGDVRVDHNVSLTGTGVDPTVTTFPYTVNYGTLSTDAFPPLYWNKYSGVLADPTVLGAAGTGSWIQDDWKNITTPANKAARINLYSTFNGWLITPPIAVPAGNYQVDFDLALMAYGNNNAPGTTGTDDIFAVLIGDGTTWTPANVVRQYDNAGSSYVLNNIPPAGTTVTLPLGTAGTKYIAFYGISTASNADNDLMIDNVLIRETPAAPIFTLSPTTWDFGAKIINTTATKQFSITNTGGGTLELTSIGITGDYFALTANGAPASLAAGQSATFTVQYAPTAVGTHTGTVTITDGRAVTEVTIDGSCYDPSISVFPHSESFDGTFPPAGWTNQATVGTLAWDQQTTGTYPTCAPNSGAAMIRYNSFSSSEGNQAIMVTPPLNLTADAYRVKFYMYRDTAYASNTDLVNVYYNNTNSATGATLLGTVNRNTTLAPAVAAAGWYPYIFNLPAAAAGNTGYVVFEAVSAYGNNMFVDDVTVELAPAGAPDNVTLLTPANGSVTVNPANVTLTWSNPATGGPATGYTVFVADDPETIFEQNTYNVNTAPATSFDLDAVLTMNYLDRWYWAVVPYNAGGESNVDDPSFQIFDFTCIADPAITSFPHLQNFDGVTAPALPAMWTTINSGAGNWTNATNITPYSAPNSMIVYYNSYSAKDEWLITPPVTMQAGVGYNVRFQLKAPGWSGTPEKLALHYGADATVAAMTANTALYDNANILQATYTEIVVPFTPATAGVYYFGWHAYSVADVDYISIDDVKIELQPQTPVFELTPNTAWAFGEVELANPGVKTFIVKNAGVSTLSLATTDISITDDAEGDFTLTANDLPVVLAANETYTFTVTFTPSTVGDKTATLNVMDTYLSVNNTVALTGTAIPEPIGNVVSLATAIQSNVNVALTWGIAYGTPGTPGWMNWDSGSTSSSIGTGAATTFAVAAKFTAGDLYNYQGMQITKLKIVPTSATATYTLKIWTGNDIDLAPVTEVYSQAVATPTVGSYNEIVLDTPYIVPVGTAVYYGYSVEETSTGYPAGADAGPAVAGKGNLIYWNSVWQELTNLNEALIYNWNVQAYADAIPTRVAGLVKDRTPRPIAVYNAPMTRESQRNNLRTERPVTATRVLRGYNIFRDNVQLNSTLVASASYLDLNLAPATYSYNVQAVYYSQNSALSATAEVTVTYVPPIELPFTEDWATNLFTTNNWTAGSTNWNNNSASGNPAPAARFSWNPQVTDYSIPLTSFNFNGVGHSSIKLAFDLSLDNYSTDAINEMTVEVWDGTAWNIVDTFSCLDNDGAGWGFTTNFYDISAYAANREFKVRFVASGEDSYEINYWYLDNIKIADLVAPTTAPVVTIAPATTAGSVTLSWDAVANADWYYVYAGTDPANVTTMLGYTTDITVDLTAVTAEFFKVTAGAGSLPTAPRLGNTTAKKTK